MENTKAPQPSGFSANDLSQNIQSPPTNQTKKSFSKNITILLLILAILFFGTGIFVLEVTSEEPQQIVSDAATMPLPEITTAPSQAPDPFTNWRTFQNKSLIVTYPPDFKVTDTASLQNPLYPTEYDHILFTKRQTIISISIVANTQNLSLSNGLGRGPYITYPQSALQKKATLVRIDGIQGIKGENIIASDSGSIIDVILINKTKLYQISLSPVNAENTQILNHMLASIKLLNVEDDELASWKTYTNAFYKYSFKYPPTLNLSFMRATPSAEPYLVTVSEKPNDSSTASGAFHIETEDPLVIGQSDTTSRLIMQLALSPFAQEKWQYNTDDKTVTTPVKKVGTIQNILLSGKSGFAFTVNGQWKDDRIAYALSEEHNYEFVENSGMKFMIWYPTSSSSAQFKQIRDTISFSQ